MFLAIAVRWANMSRRLRLSALGAALAVAVGGAAQPAIAEPPATSAVRVEIQAEHVSGLRPNGTTVIFRIKAVAQGGDASSLVGEGRHFGSGGAHNYWRASGYVDGNVVTLAGVVAESNNPLLVGVPVKLTGDSSTGAIDLEFGPLPEGAPYNGGTIFAEGFGRVKINTR
jgi:hypothetical protein